MRYYVGFYSTSERQWWDRFNRTGFDHCNAWAELKGFHTIGVEYNRMGLDAVYHPLPAAAILEEVLERPDCTCVVEIERTERVEFAARGVLTCVSAVKAFLGMPGCPALTPWQLARTLLAQKGVLHRARSLGG